MDRDTDLAYSKDPDNIKMSHLTLQGRNAYYNPNSKNINMGSKTLKGKQSVSQFMLKHEEGHAKSYGSTNNRGYKDHDRPETREFIDNYVNKNMENKINIHDDSVDELEADKYAVQNMKIRTKKMEQEM